MSTQAGKHSRKAVVVAGSEAALRGAGLGVTAALIYGVPLLFLAGLLPNTHNQSTALVEQVLLLPVFLFLVVLVGALPAYLIGWLTGHALAGALNRLQRRGDLAAGLAGLAVALLIILLLHLAGAHIGLTPAWEVIYLSFLGVPSLIYAGLSIFMSIKLNRELWYR